MKKKTSIIIVMLSILILTSACQKKELTQFEKPYVAGIDFSLPYRQSWQEINSRPLEEIISELRLYDTEENYFIVDNEGNTMNNDYPKKANRNSNEYIELAKTIKDSAWQVVEKDMFFVTTAEKEIKALFDGERKVHGAEVEEVIFDNKDAYKAKDYQKINDYLISRNIKVWKSQLNN